MICLTLLEVAARAVRLPKNHYVAGHRRAGAAQRGSDPHRRAHHVRFGAGHESAGGAARPIDVFQSYAIWPHMTVFENVAYSLRVRRKSAAEIKKKVGQALALVKMEAYASRNASQLSGGQQQRVALARACAFLPQALLFDEPLSNLDAKLRAEMRIELLESQHSLGVTSLYVTHDLEEALAMSDNIIVMRGGHIEQSGSPGPVYNYPRTAFVAKPVMALR